MVRTVRNTRDVVGMIEEKGIPIKVVAKDMGVRVDLLYSWKRKYGKGVKESEGRNNLYDSNALSYCPEPRAGELLIC